MAKKRIITECVSVWDESKQMYVTESEKGYDYYGEVAECKSFFKAKSPPAAPPPPAPQVVQDLINGVETSTETRDGKTYTITRQLPLTAEQQAIKDDLTARMDRIDKLSTGIAALNPDYAPVLQQIKDWQSQTRASMFGEANRAQQDELARRGLGNSTAAAQSNAMLALQQGQQTQADAVNLYGLAEQQRATDLTNQTNALQLKSGLNQQNLSNLSNAGNATAGRQQSQLSLDSQIQQQNYNNQLAAFNATKPSGFQQLLNAGAAIGGAYLGSSAGLSSLPSLGSMFGTKAAAATSDLGGLTGLNTKLNSKLGF